MQCHFLGTAFLFIRGDSVHSTQDSWLNSRIGITCGSGCSDCFRYGSDCCSGSDFSDCSGSGCCSGYGFPFENPPIFFLRFSARLVCPYAGGLSAWFVQSAAAVKRETWPICSSLKIWHQMMRSEHALIAACICRKAVGAAEMQAAIYSILHLLF